MAGNKKQTGGDNSINIQLENFVVDGHMANPDSVAELLSILKSSDLAGSGPIRFYSGDVRDIIEAIDSQVDISVYAKTSAFDFTTVDLSTKNKLNGMGQDYFDIIRQHHEPYFHRIDGFLHATENEQFLKKYYQIVDEIRGQIAAHQAKFDSFELILVYLFLAGTESSSVLKDKRRVFNVFLSFMYFNCDIGRKDAAPEQVSQS